MLRRTSAIVLVLAVLAAGGACKRGDGAASKPDVDRNEVLPMKVSLALHGDIEATFTEQTVDSTVVVLLGKAVGQYQVFGIEPVDLVTTSTGKVKAGVAVTPFRGDGKYTIEPGSPYDLAKNPGAGVQSGQSQAQSSVRVEWEPNGGERVEFLRREKPCTVEVAEGGMRGRVQCPQLTHEGETRFSLDLRWEKP